MNIRRHVQHVNKGENQILYPHFGSLHFSNYRYISKLTTLPRAAYQLHAVHLSQIERDVPVGKWMITIIPIHFMKQQVFGCP